MTLRMITKNMIRESRKQYKRSKLMFTCLEIKLISRVKALPLTKVVYMKS
jgi:hypothetical protein